MNIKAELAAMERMSTGELVERYAALSANTSLRRFNSTYAIRI